MAIRHFNHPYHRLYMVRVIIAATGQVVFSDEYLSPDTLKLTVRDLQPTTSSLVR